MGACNSSSELKYPVETAPQAELSLKPLHTSSILHVCRLNSDSVLTCSDDKTIAKYNWESGEKTTYLGHEKSVNKVVAAADGNSFWSASRDLSIRQWDTKTSKCLQVLTGPTLNVSALANTADGRFVASGSRDYSVRAYDIFTGQLLNTYSAPRNIVTALEYNEAGHLLFQASEDLCVRIWDTRQSKNAPSVHIKSFVYFPTCLKIASQHIFATGCKGFDGTGCEVKLFDLRMPSEPIAEFRGHQHDVTGIAFMGSYISSVSRDGTFRLWSYHANPLPHETHAFQDKNYYTSLAHLRGNGSCGTFAATDMNGQLTILSCDVSAKDKHKKSVTTVLHETPPSVDDDR